MRAGASEANRGPVWLPWLGEHAVLLLGLITIALLWAGVGRHVEDERGAIEAAVQQNTSNLARVFEEHIALAMKELDGTLLLVREAYLRDPKGFDLQSWTAHPAFASRFWRRISVIGPDGNVITSTAGPTQPTNLGDREHFLHHRDSAADDLYISKPVIGRIIPTLLIPMSRPIRNRDGSFGGAVAAAIDPDYLASFYNSVDIGILGNVTLLRADGILLARQQDDPGTIGESLAGSALMAAVARQPVGGFTGLSSIDQVRRIFSFRALRDFPLIVAVSVAVDEVMAPQGADERMYIAAAIIFTSLTLLLTILADRHRRSLRARSAELADKNAILEASRARLTMQATELAMANEGIEASRRDAERARDAAETANRAKSEFLASMSHELRTPLNGIIGFSQLLTAQTLGPLGSDNYAAFARDIHASAERLLLIINDILDISKLEAGRVELQAVDFDLPEVVVEVATLLRPRAEQKGLRLETSLDEHAQQAFLGDPVRLRQVLFNLVDNAVKFTERGRVDIEARAQGVPSPGTPLQLRFDIRDTGIGIAAGARSRLFQKFSQADSSIARRFGGTGLGLVICKQLVELMGGKIGVDTVEGQGSIFWFTLTLAPVEASATTSPRLAGHIDIPTERTAHAAAGKRVLVVEDNKINQHLTGSVLQKAGYEVELVNDGAAALLALERTDYDLILMDIEMPEMDGTETTRRIRALSAAKRGVPIVALTAHAMRGVREAYLAAGMDDYLSKPFAVATLLQVAARWTAPQAAVARTGAEEDG